MYRLGLASYGFHRALGAGELDVMGLIELTADHGALVLEFDPLADGRATPDEAERLEAIRRRLSDRGIEPILKANPLGSHPLTVEGGAAAALIDEMKRRFTIAGRIGAGIVRLVARARQYPPDWSRARRDRALRANLRELCGLAQGMGLIVALENHADLTAAEIGELIDRVGSRNFRLTLDVANNGVLFEDPLRVVRELLPYAVSVHLKNFRSIWYPDGFRLTCSRPREGIIDLDALFAALGEAPASRKIALLVEAHVERDLDETAVFREYLAEIRSSSLALVH